MAAVSQDGSSGRSQAWGAVMFPLVLLHPFPRLDLRPKLGQRGFTSRFTTLINNLSSELPALLSTVPTATCRKTAGRRGTLLNGPGLLLRSSGQQGAITMLQIHTSELSLFYPFYFPHFIAADFKGSADLV